MADENDTQRTEQATPRRLEQAREEGQVARSRELSTSLLMLASALLFAVAGPRLVAGFERLMRKGLSLAPADAFDTASMLNRLLGLSFDGLAAAAPVLLVLVATALLAPTLIGGWIFSARAVQPDITRLSPLRGLKLVFSWHGAGELIKALLKALLVAAATLWVLWQAQGELLALGAGTSERGTLDLGGLLSWSFLVLSASLAVVAAADVPFQIWRHRKGLSMTRDEVRKEMRETEGDPQVKQRIRSEQRARARRRMMAEVPKADVIVTNPLHYAVALRYSESNMRAPTMVAKGAELLAARIRDLGREHGVPILEAPPLARALYFHAEIGQEIPAPLYNAVAQVLAWVYQLRGWRTAGRGNEPAAPRELPVPAQFDSRARRGGP